MQTIGVKVKFKLMKKHHEAPKIVHVVIWSLASVLAIALTILITIQIYSGFGNTKSDTESYVRNNGIISP